MSIDNIKNQIDLLKIIADPKNKYSKLLLKSGNRKLINTICEIIYNVLSGKIKISDQNKEKWKNFRKTLLKLVDNNQNFKQRRKILVQKGGFLQFILPAVITGIASIISSAISSSWNIPQSIWWFLMLNQSSR